MSASRMRIAVTADTRNFDAAMRHVRGQAAQARRAVSPTLGAMGMGGAGRMAGMGLGMAAMSGPMGAIAAATAAVAAAVNAIKERNASQDKSVREMIEKGMAPQQHAQFQAMAQMLTPGGTAADIQQLIDKFQNMTDQQRLDLEQQVGPAIARGLATETGQQFMMRLATAQQRTGGAFADEIGGKEGGMIRALSRLSDLDIGRAFSTQANLGDAVRREDRRVEDIGGEQGFFLKLGRFFERWAESYEMGADQSARRERELKRLEAVTRPLPV